MRTKEHSGFIGLIGKPNVGKSTLLNKLIGQNLSITTPKPQTTRNRLIGIRTQGTSQMIFIDTPGIHESNIPLNQKMNEYAVQTIEETDLNIWLVEPLKPYFKKPHHDELKILDLIGSRSRSSSTMLVINKIDLADQERILRTIDTFNQLGSFSEIIPISALKSNNLDNLLNQLEHYLPEHPFFFDSDQLTDTSERFLVAELVREQIFRKLQQEIPYSTAVQVVDFQENSDCLKLDCFIYVERESQKGILIGKGGSMLKQIGTAAREKIEKLLGQRVFLALHVKVVKQWTRKANQLKALGYK
jgi:GTPase